MPIFLERERERESLHRARGVHNACSCATSFYKYNMSKRGTKNLYLYILSNDIDKSKAQITAISFYMIDEKLNFDSIDVDTEFKTN